MMKKTIVDKKAMTMMKRIKKKQKKKRMKMKNKDQIALTVVMKIQQINYLKSTNLDIKQML